MLDKTGYYQIDQNIDLGTIGIQYGYKLSNHFNVGFRIGITSTTNIIHEELILFGETNVDERIILSSTGTEINPFLEYQPNLTPWLQLAVEASYNIDLSEKFELNGQETDIKPDWSGYRLSIGLVIVPSELMK